MPKRSQSQEFVGRRLRLRDLHVFLTVAQTGSMAKAAAQLGISQPAVSEAISGLEHGVRARLFDRAARGVVLTGYGDALLKRAVAAFDELTQGLRDIEVLSDPSAGEVCIGCAESVASAILPPIVQRFSDEYPRVIVRVEQVTSPGLTLPELRARTMDIVLARLVRPVSEDTLADDLNVETLFDDVPMVAVGAQSRWARRRSVELAELAGERWILTPPTTMTAQSVVDAFRSRGLQPPRATLETYSIHLRTNLLTTTDFVAVFFSTVFERYAERFALKALPVELPQRASTIALVSLKNRTLSSAAQRFMEHARAYTASLSELAGPGASKSSRKGASVATSRESETKAVR